MKFSQTDLVYCKDILNLSSNYAKEAASHNVHRYIEISSEQMFSTEKQLHKEDGPMEPWTFASKWKPQVEKQMENVPNLRYTIVRSALVYGLGDKAGLTMRLVAASVYRELGETMKLLWNADVCLNTVHLMDLCRAVMFVCGRENTVGQVYNVADEACSTQGSMANIFSEIFGIKIDYYGSLISTVGDLNSTADKANDKHLAAWAEVCKREGIQNTPLTSHMNTELLSNKHLNLDTSKLQDLGYRRDVPKLTADNVRATIQDFTVMGIFPKSLL